MTNPETLSSELLFELLEIATKRHGELQGKWIRAMAGIAQAQGARGPAVTQSDYRVDLILRTLESEANKLYALNEDKGIVVLNLQMSLSRYWVLSMYEALRIVERGGHVTQGFGSLYHRFRLLRVPLAKGQIAQDSKLSPDPDSQEEAWPRRLDAGALQRH